MRQSRRSTLFFLLVLSCAVGALLLVPAAGAWAQTREVPRDPEKPRDPPKPEKPKEEPKPEPREPVCRTVCTTEQECTLETYVDGEICMPSEPPVCLPRYRTRRICNPVEVCKEVCR